MDCTNCKTKMCRTKRLDCKTHDVDVEAIIHEYKKEENRKVVRAAANLVDNGRAGTLSRLREIKHFIAELGYSRIGIAYCFALENEAARVKTYLEKSDHSSPNPSIIPVSCTVGAVPQSTINPESSIGATSCDPIGQARQLNAENIDLCILMGLCLGHDILFQKYIDAPVTTFVVKDRVHGHCPLKGIP